MAQRPIPLRDFEGKGRIATDLPGPPAQSGAGAFSQAAKEFEDLSKYLGGMADKAAVREGKEAGVAAAAEAGTDEQGRPVMVALRKDGTLRGEAYDKAAIDLYWARFSTGVREELFENARTHERDPAALRAANEKTKRSYLAGLVQDPQIVADFDKRFEDMRFPYEKGAVRARDGELKDTAAAEYNGSIETAETDLKRAARSMGADGEGDQALARETTRLRRMIENARDAGYLTPAAAAARIRNISLQVEEQKVLGAFDRLETPAQKTEFITKLRQDYQNGKTLSAVDPARFDLLHHKLQSQLRRDVTTTSQGIREVQSEIRSITERVIGGYGMTEQEWERVDRIASQSGDPLVQQAAQKARTFAARAELWWQLTPDELSRSIAAERMALGLDKQATPEQRDERAATINAMGKTYDAMTKEAAHDMLSLAERTGRVLPTALSPLVLTNPQLMAENFPKRAAAAEEAAESFGLPPQYFRQQERAEWQALLNAGGEQAAVAVAGMMKFWGPERARRALGELNAKATVMTTAGAVVAAGGDPQFLADVAEGQKLRRMPDYKPLNMQPADVDPIVQQLYGEAFSGAPGAAAQAKAAAITAFDVRARTQGIGTNLQAKSEGKALLARTLQEAAGAVFDGAIQYGGVAPLNGRSTIVPSQMRADRMADVIAAVRDEDLAANPPMAANNKPLRASDVRQGVLVAVGAGRYRVALGDPDSQRPQWIMNGAGDPWVFDLAALEPALKQRRPDLYRGGGALPPPPRRGSIRNAPRYVPEE